MNDTRCGNREVPISPADRPAGDTVIYSDPFIPPEWIAAHGFKPCRPALRVPDGAPAVEGMCPYAAAFARCSAQAGAVAAIFTTACDQMRRACESAALHRATPSFLMNLPATWQSATPHSIYREELTRLGRFLLSLGGRVPSDTMLRAVMLDYQLRRQKLHDLRGILSPGALAEATMRFHCDGVLPALPPAETQQPGGVPVALVGGPLPESRPRLFELIERAGGAVVLDATETGERTLPAPFDLRAIERDPLTALAEAYFGAIPDARLRPNHLLYTWLRDRLAERGVRGVLLVRWTWCDLWHAEAQRLKEWAPMPVLSLTLEGGGPDHGHLASRIEAFLEMLK